MVQLSPAERTLVDELLSCIAEAMTRLDEVDQAYASKTKLQKLLYLAIEEFDIPLTYSWYLAGAVVPDDAATPGALQTAFDELPGGETPSISSDDKNHPAADESSMEWNMQQIRVDIYSSTSAQSAPAEDIIGADDSNSPEKTTEPDTTVDPVLFSDTSTPGGDDRPTAGSSLGDSRDEVVDFYEATIPDVWHQSTMRFLQNFYLEYAPPAYRDLYVQSTHFRTRLRELETIVNDQVKDGEPTDSVDGAVQAAGLDVSDMHCTIQASDSLSPTFDAFVEGTDLIEDGLMMLAKRSPNALDTEHVTAIHSIQEFFYYYVWRYPCLVVSQETATGPSAEELRTNRQRRLTNFEAELQRETEEFEQELANVGLVPDYTDYAAPDDEVEEIINELADQYLE